MVINGFSGFLHLKWVFNLSLPYIYIVCALLITMGSILTQYDKQHEGTSRSAS
ncbi:hypothetical protein Hanom_Chr12g01170801 [Helianthus anomalus]